MYVAAATIPDVLTSDDKKKIYESFSKLPLDKLNEQYHYKLGICGRNEMAYQLSVLAEYEHRHQRYAEMNRLDLCKGRSCLCIPRVCGGGKLPRLEDYLPNAKYEEVKPEKKKKSEQTLNQPKTQLSGMTPAQSEFNDFLRDSDKCIAKFTRARVVRMSKKRQQPSTESMKKDPRYLKLFDSYTILPTAQIRDEYEIIFGKPYHDDTKFMVDALAFYHFNCSK